MFTNRTTKIRMEDFTSSQKCLIKFSNNDDSDLISHNSDSFLGGHTNDNDHDEETTIPTTTTTTTKTE